MDGREVQKMSVITKPLMVYLPDTRGVEISPFGRGNLKLGPGVYTYSRLPGRPEAPALGGTSGEVGGTCPGASNECLAICYAARPVAEHGVVAAMWRENSYASDVPELPDDAKLLRLHVSGDFDSYDYIVNWITRMVERPDVTMWVYTRSWRMPHLLPALEVLRALPNVQMFASMDGSVPEIPPEGWRRAWIDGDPRAGVVYDVNGHSAAAYAAFDDAFHLEITQDGTKAILCPEETGKTANCEDCEFCFKGQRNDVVFLKH